MSTPAALVLSPTPPRPKTRESFVARFGPDTAFLDLAALRRSGLASLRRQRASTVVVTGEPDELGLFEDYLVALAFLVPCSSRRRVTTAGDDAVIGARHLVRSAARILAGALAGGWSLASAWWRARRFASRSFAPRALAGTSRCLYLKPMLSFGASVGGSVAHVAGVVNALVRSGTTVTMVTPIEQPMVGASVDRRLVPPQMLISFPFEVNQHRYQRRFLRAAWEEARRTRPDFIYQRYALNDLSGAVLARALGIPLVLEFNGSEVWAQRHWGQPVKLESLSQSIESANLRHAELVVVVSQALVGQAVGLGAPQERVLFYPNGIDPLVFDPARFSDEDREVARRELGVPTDATLLTFVGTFGRWHGTDVLARAIRLLIDRERGWLEARRAHFLYVGDGALAPTVREILGPGLGHPFVTLAGLRPQAQTPRTLAASDVLLSPHVPNPDGTPFFGSPTKLFEYMAMERPIVASDLDQVGWVLKGWRPGEPPPPAGSPGRTSAAVLVEPGNLDALVGGIRRVLEMSAAERAALGRKARRLVLESFTWDRNVEAVLARLRTDAGTARADGSSAS